MMASSQFTICDLPDEVLCYIFLKLEVEQVIKCLMNVCQRWRSVVAENKMFWNNLQLSIDCGYFIGYSYLDEETIKRSTHQDNWPYASKPTEILIGEKDLDKVPNLKSIKFTEGSKVIAQSISLLMRILEIIRKSCTEIEKVEFIFCFGAISDEFLRFLNISYNNIKEIKFAINDGYRLPYCEISRFVNLHTLVSHDRMFKSSDLYILAENCEHLNSLWVLLSSSLKTEDVLYFLEKKKKTLKELGIGITLNDCILNKVKECHNLKVFFSSDARYVTDDCVKSFAHLSSLKYCSLHQARFQRATVLEIAGQYRKPGIFGHLKILDLTGYYHYSTEMFYSWNDRSRDSCNTLTTTAEKNSSHRQSRDSRESMRLNDLSEESNNSGLMCPIEITFTNPVTRAITQMYNHPSYSFHPMDHWMYLQRIPH